jgi:acetylglutamate kinase
MQTQAHHNLERPFADLRGRHIDAGVRQGVRSQAEPSQEACDLGTIVVKIGGSTLGSHDTTLADLVALQKQGVNPVVVHGGGKVISDWMERQGVRPRFVGGLRVTDRKSLDIAVAVLTGLINKSLVASLLALGGRAMGISGVDGAMLRAVAQDPELGHVGRVAEVNPGPIRTVLYADCIPVIAPVGVRGSDESEVDGSLLNINADTAAGEIAAALHAERLVFLTDVEGVLDSSRRVIPRLTLRQARGLMRSRVVGGGMVPKLEACVSALKEVGDTRIVDGRRSGALMDALSGKARGTRVG